MFVATRVAATQHLSYALPFDHDNDPGVLHLAAQVSLSRRSLSKPCDGQEGKLGWVEHCEAAAMSIGDSRILVEGITTSPDAVLETYRQASIGGSVPAYRVARISSTIQWRSAESDNDPERVPRNGGSTKNKAGSQKFWYDQKRLLGTPTRDSPSNNYLDPTTCIYALSKGFLQGFDCVGTHFDIVPKFGGMDFHTGRGVFLLPAFEDRRGLGPTATTNCSFDGRL